MSSTIYTKLDELTLLPYFSDFSLAMFRDYKSGGYNLEGSKANIVRLTNLILLIAIAYTSASLSGKSFKNQGYQKYITRLTEAQRKYRRLGTFSKKPGWARHKNSG